MDTLNPQSKPQKKIKNLPGRPKGTGKKQKLLKRFYLNIADFKQLDPAYTDRLLRKLCADYFKKSPRITLDRITTNSKQEFKEDVIDNSEDTSIKSGYSSASQSLDINSTKSHLNVFKQNLTENNEISMKIKEVESVKTKLDLQPDNNIVSVSNNIVTELDVNKLKLTLKNLINHRSSATFGDDKISREHPGEKLSDTSSLMKESNTGDNNWDSQEEDREKDTNNCSRINRENDLEQQVNTNVTRVSSNEAEGKLQSETRVNDIDDCTGDKDESAELKSSSQNNKYEDSVSGIHSELPVLAEITSAGTSQVSTSPRYPHLQPPILTPENYIDTLSKLSDDVSQVRTESFDNRGEKQIEQEIITNKAEDGIINCTNLRVFVVEENIENNQTIDFDSTNVNRVAEPDRSSDESTFEKNLNRNSQKTYDDKETEIVKERNTSLSKPSTTCVTETEPFLQPTATNKKSKSVVKTEPDEIVRKPLHQHDGYDSDATMIYDDEDEQNTNVWMYRKSSECNPLKIKQTQQLLRLKSKLVQPSMERDEVVKSPETIECIQSLYPSDRGEVLDKSEDASNNITVGEIVDIVPESCSVSNAADSSSQEEQKLNATLDEIEKPITKIRIALKPQKSKTKVKKQHKSSKKNSRAIKLSACKWEQAITSADAVILTDLTISRGNDKKHSEQKTKKSKHQSHKKPKTEKRKKHESQDMVLKNINKIFPKPRRKRTKDEDDLPTILPPKRRRQGKGQVTSDSKSDIDRINQEFPQFNWLEKKYKDKGNIDSVVAESKEKAQLYKAAHNENGNFVKELEDKLSGASQNTDIGQQNNQQETNNMEQISAEKENLERNVTMTNNTTDYNENDVQHKTAETVPDNLPPSPDEAQLVIAEDIDENSEVLEKSSDSTQAEVPVSASSNVSFRYPVDVGTIEKVGIISYAESVITSEIPTSTSANRNISDYLLNSHLIQASTETDRQSYTEAKHLESVKSDNNASSVQSATSVISTSTVLSTSVDCISIRNESQSIPLINQCPTSSQQLHFSTYTSSSNNEVIQTPVSCNTCSAQYQTASTATPSYSNAVGNGTSNQHLHPVSEDSVVKRPRLAAMTSLNTTETNMNNIPPLIPVSVASKQNKVAFSKSKLLGPEVEATYNEIKQIKKELEIRNLEAGQMMCLLREKEELLRTLLLSSPFGPNKTQGHTSIPSEGSAVSCTVSNKLPDDHKSSFSGMHGFGGSSDFRRIPPPAHACKKENTKEILKALDANPVRIPPDIKATCPFTSRKRPLSPPTTRFKSESWQGPLPAAHTQKPFEVPGRLINVKAERSKSQENGATGEICLSTSRAVSAPAADQNLGSPVNLQQTGGQLRSPSMNVISSPNNIQLSNFQSSAMSPTIQSTTIHNINNHMSTRQVPVSKVIQSSTSMIPVNHKPLSPRENINKCTENAIQQELNEALKRRQKEHKPEQDYQQFKIVKPVDNSHRLKAPLNHSVVSSDMSSIGGKEAPIIRSVPNTRPRMYTSAKGGHQLSAHPGELLNALQRTPQHGGIINGRMTNPSGIQSSLPQCVRLIGAATIPSNQSIRMNDPSRVVSNQSSVCKQQHMQQQYSPVAVSGNAHMMQGVIRQPIPGVNLNSGVRQSYHHRSLTEGGKPFLPVQVAAPVQPNSQITNNHHVLPQQMPSPQGQPVPTERLQKGHHPLQKTSSQQEGTAPVILEQIQTGRSLQHRQGNSLPQETSSKTQHIFGSCIMCGKFSLYLCSTCQNIWYCSQQCQLKHWTTHQHECKYSAAK